MTHGTGMKLIAVAYPTGRIGSSALMGLLKLCGLDVGRESALIPAAAMNPKGFFELRSQQAFLCDTFRGYYPDVSDPPTPAVADEIGAVHFPRYGELVQAEFAGPFPAAVKSQRGLTLPFLHRLRDRYDVRVLVLHRSERDHVRSTLRVWRGLEDPLRRHADEAFVRRWIGVWRAFTQDLLERYRFPRLSISFDELLAEPRQITAALAGFLDIAAPPAAAVDGWLDRSLVNRESIG